MKTEHKLYFSGYREIRTTLDEVLRYIPKSWHGIVTKLIDDLFEAGWDGRIGQVKEKFGGLRFYIDHGNDEIYGLIDEAEQKTETICIVCGDPATSTTKGWFTHVCDEHKDT